MTLFLLVGFNCFNATEVIRGDNLPFTNKSTGVHFNHDQPQIYEMLSQPWSHQINSFIKHVIAKKHVFNEATMTFALKETSHVNSLLLFFFSGSRNL